MIDVALTFIKDYLVAEFTGSGVGVSISSLPKDPDTDNSSDNIFITLLNLEEEKVIRSQPAYKPAPFPFTDTRVRLVNPEIRLNLYLLLTAQFKKENYLSSLRYISKTIATFQGRNVFTKDYFASMIPPGDYPGIEKLIVELYSPTFEQNNQIWQILGSRMMPFVLYKVRMIVLEDDYDDDDFVREVPLVQAINTDISTS